MASFIFNALDFFSFQKTLIYHIHSNLLGYKLKASEGLSLLKDIQSCLQDGVAVLIRKLRNDFPVICHQKKKRQKRKGDR
jgi:hypothetical protein